MSQSEEQMLSELQASILFAPDFPKRISYSHEQWEANPEQAMEASHRPKGEAIERARSCYRHLEQLVRKLGEARYEPAIPTLARLWRECALVPVRPTVGFALSNMQTEEARSALESTIEDSDSADLAVNVVFDRDPDRAYDYFEHRFHAGRSGSSAVAHAVLRLFRPSSYRFRDGKRIPGWDIEPRAPDWLKKDPRWLELCARLRHDEGFRDAARDVLRHAGRSDVLAVLDRVRKAEAQMPQRAETRTARAGDLLAQYRSGEFETVWREIRLHRRIGGDFREEVREVAEETMRRVARNADLISERLQARGWRPLFGQLRTHPSSDDYKVFERIERIGEGPIPPSLRAFWTVVGGVDWVWDYKSGEACPDLRIDLPMNEMDPLCVHPASQLDYLCDEWEEEWRDQPDPDLVDPFYLDLAPDRFHKANISGGGGYGFELPFFGADPVFANELHKLPFVDYLRLCFRWAGFPGLDQHGDRQDVQRYVREFRRGIEPF